MARWSVNHYISYIPHRDRQYLGALYVRTVLAIFQFGNAFLRTVSRWVATSAVLVALQ